MENAVKIDKATKKAIKAFVGLIANEGIDLEIVTSEFNYEGATYKLTFEKTCISKAQ